MRKRTLGKTGVEVSELGLGTWGLSGDAYGPVAPEVQRQLIERARLVGITFFETADCYANGQMESLLGELLADDPATLIATKWGTDRDGSVARKRFDAVYLRTACEKSLERLKRQTVTLGLLHNPSVKALQNGEATETLKALKAEGKLACWGVSAGDEASAVAALDAGAEVLSLTYNPFRQKPLKVIADRLRQDATGVLVHSVLNYGQLCGMWSPYRLFRTPDHRAERWTPEELKARARHLDALRPLIGGGVTSLRAGALRFALHQPLTGSVLVGPKTSMQLDQLVREGAQTLPYLTESQATALQNRLEELQVEA